mmetsp:Transcript_93331/g.243335  ORF Transcript_93331/g.243335 Transcript_93331/m.243335 type:complete len:250 (-) Transcript_93331:72-821(-)
MPGGMGMGAMPGGTPGGMPGGMGMGGMPGGMAGGLMGMPPMPAQSMPGMMPGAQMGALGADAAMEGEQKKGFGKGKGRKGGGGKGKGKGGGGGGGWGKGGGGGGGCSSSGAAAVGAAPATSSTPPWPASAAGPPKESLAATTPAGLGGVTPLQLEGLLKSPSGAVAGNLASPSARYPMASRTQPTLPLQSWAGQAQSAASPPLAGGGLASAGRGPPPLVPRLAMPLAGAGSAAQAWSSPIVARPASART